MSLTIHHKLSCLNIYFFQLSPEVVEQKVWLLELSEYLLWLVNLILEVYAAIVETRSEVNTGVLENITKSTGRLLPK